MDKQTTTRSRSASASHRSQPAGTYRTRAAQQTRPATHTTASYIHKETPEAEENEQKKSRRAKKSNKRRRASVENKPKKNIPWKIILPVLGAVIVIAVILALALSIEPGVHHQMPKVTPPETANEGMNTGDAIIPVDQNTVIVVDEIVTEEGA